MEIEDSIGQIRAELEETNFGLVLYTDGSAKTDRPLAGWGVHGYVYTMDEPKLKTLKKRKDSPTTVGYHDGRVLEDLPRCNKSGEFPIGDRSFLSKLKTFEKRDKLALELLPAEPKYYIDFSGGQVQGTVSTAEMNAMKEALLLIKMLEPKQAVILADSQYVLSTVVDYYHRWKANGWKKSKGDTPDHLEEWHRIMEIYQFILDSDTQLVLTWVKGHSSEPGNEKADFLASLGNNLALFQKPDRKSIVSSRGYVPNKKINNRLIEHRWWYATAAEGSDELVEGRYVYFFGNHGKAEEEEDLVGKSTPTAKVSILITREPEPVLETLHNEIRERYDDGTDRVVLGYAETIFGTKAYPDMLELGRDILYPVANKPLIISPDRVPLIKELNPPYLGWRLIEYLHDTLSVALKGERIIESGKLNEDCICLTNITDLVYVKTTNAKGKSVIKTSDNINPPAKVFTAALCYKLKDEIKEKKIKLKLGQDIPTRNTLAAVMTDQTQVYAITMRTGTSSFIFGTIVMNGEDVLFSTAYKSNQIILVGEK